MIGRDGSEFSPIGYLQERRGQIRRCNRDEKLLLKSQVNKDFA